MKLRYLMAVSLVGLVGVLIGGRPAFASWGGVIPGGATPTQPVGGSTGCSPKEGGDFRFANQSSAGFGIGPLNLGGNTRVAPGFALALIQCLPPQVIKAIESLSDEDISNLPKETRRLYMEIKMVVGKMNLQHPSQQQFGASPPPSTTTEVGRQGEVIDFNSITTTEVGRQGEVIDFNSL